MTDRYIPRPISARTLRLLRVCWPSEPAPVPILNEAWADLEQYLEDTRGLWSSKETRETFDVLLTDLCRAVFVDKDPLEATRIALVLNAHARSCGPVPTLGHALMET